MPTARNDICFHDPTEEFCLKICFYNTVLEFRSLQCLFRLAAKTTPVITFVDSSVLIGQYLNLEHVTFCIHVTRGK